MATSSKNKPAKKTDSLKLCICGAESVGKTALLIQFLKGDFSDEDDPTIEDSHTAKHTVDNKETALEILDTGGSNAYVHLHSKWFSWGEAFLLVFSVSARYSFDMIPQYVKEIETSKKGTAFSLILVGNQCDEERPRQVTKEQALELAYNYSCHYIETSAKKNVNVKEAFEQLIRESRTKQQETELIVSYEQMHGATKKKKNDLSIMDRFSSKEKREEKLKKNEEKKTVEMDNALSIIKDPVRRKELCHAVPKFKVVPLKSKVEIGKISGPTEDGSLQTIKDFVAARGVSTYPLKGPDFTKREGDPICDQYVITSFENRTIVALADGCNWGDEVKLAANKAVTVFTEYMKKHQKEIQTTRNVGYIIMRAYLAAHNSIIEGRTEETLYQAGTTTMLAGMLLEIEPENPNDPKWIFVYVGLGDCKTFHWDSKTGEISDITEGNRQNITDARDPGGRLGPYLEGGAPDLRNLKVYSKLCNPGDILFVVSDGIHDNLDPQSLGKTPKELNINAESWADLDPNKDATTWAEAEKIKQLFAKKFVNALAGGSKATPASIAKKLTDHALQLTQPSRDFMEQNWNKKLPPDYTKYPGKMDHSTCVAFEVGMRQLEKQPPVHKASNKDPSQYWEVHTTESGEKYFYNRVTMKSTWEDPFVKTNSDWHVYYDDTGEMYYYNSKTKEVSWDPPEELKKANSTSASTSASAAPPSAPSSSSASSSSTANGGNMHSNSSSGSAKPTNTNATATPSTAPNTSTGQKIVKSGSGGNVSVKTTIGGMTIGSALRTSMDRNGRSGSK